MAKNKDSRLVILRFSDNQELREFFKTFDKSEAGSLVKVGDDNDYSNNKKKDMKKTRWSDWGIENLDQKNSEKTSLI